MEQIDFTSTSTFSLDTLGEIFTRSFEGYFYPGTTSGAMLATRARIEQLDLLRSLVMRVDGEPAGIAMLALRGERAWCGGFGVAAPFRGRGLSHQLVAAMLASAREAGADACSLEVLTRNERAIKTYLRAGFAITRDLRIFEWRSPEGWSAEHTAGASGAGDGVSEQPPAVLLEHFAALHPAPAGWQRDLPALLVRGKLHGVKLGQPARPAAYALLSAMPDGGMRIEDLGARDAQAATDLLVTLQRRFVHLASVNEPADSPITVAFDAAGFAESDRQHEMIVHFEK
jgi:GNAT superfamily N-acetyltransferase